MVVLSKEPHFTAISSPREEPAWPASLPNQNVPSKAAPLDHTKHGNAQGSSASVRQAPAARDGASFHRTGKTQSPSVELASI